MVVAVEENGKRNCSHVSVFVISKSNGTSKSDSAVFALGVSSGVAVVVVLANSNRYRCCCCRC